ncbi:hypothetical protein AB0J83_08550 [Actinoplanes sp. NPDC049596]|uniref:hypothetical protein n=1 Tax=unclassified Actinoplanes TaxID=2626549 RepID=UPI00343C88B1
MHDLMGSPFFIIGNSRALHGGKVATYLVVPDDRRAADETNNVRRRLTAGAPACALLSEQGPPRTLVLDSQGDLYENSRLVKWVRDLVAACTTDAEDVENWIPLFYVRPSEGGKTYSLFGQVRFNGQDALFLRLAEEETESAGGSWDDDVRTLFSRACRLQDAGARALGNPRGTYRRLLPDRELETKYQLLAPVDLWGITSECHARVARGKLDGFTVEFGDELKRFDALNTMYEITGPPEHRGYMSFSPTAAGPWIIKKKWFTSDGYDRGERIWRTDELAAGTFEGELNELGLDGRRLGAFRRVSYEAHLESGRTGHVYTIVADESRVEGDGEQPTLRQCEVEYVHTRSYLPPNEESITPELERVTEFLGGVLTDLGIRHESTFYSKLSFMRDATRPSALDGVTVPSC